MSAVGDFYAQVVMIAAAYGWSVTSGYRSARRNATVGGVPNSRHLVGLAVDLASDVDSRAKEEIAYQLEAAGFVVLDEGDHLHVHVPRAP